MLFLQRVDNKPQFREIGRGKVNDLNVAANSFNDVRLVVNDRGANLFVNNNERPVATLDVSARIARGDVAVATGFSSAQKIPGRSTRYENFTAFAIER